LLQLSQATCVKIKPRCFLAGFLFSFFILLLNGCTTSSSTANFSTGNLLCDLPGIPDRVVLTEVPFFPQQDYQCGPASLAMVLAYRKVTVTPDDLVKQIYLPERKGTLTPEIVAAVRQYEFVPYVLPGGMHDLLIEVAAGNPVLVMQNLGLSWYPVWHYSVVIGYDMKGQYLIMRSGVDAERITTFRNFENTWARADHWALVVAARDQLPATASVLPWLQDADDLSATGHDVGAHHAYVMASEKWPENDMVWFALGNSFYQQQKPAEAEQAYRRALDIKNINPEVLNNLAYALSGQGCRRQAIRAANCAAIQAPENISIQETMQELSSKHFSQPQSSLHCSAVNYCAAVGKIKLSKQ